MSIIKIEDLVFSYNNEIANAKKGKKSDHNHRKENEKRIEGENDGILKSLNFSMEAGESVGLVGANGAGKSTLLKLLVGILDHYQGKLEVAGRPMIPKNYKEIRKAIGYVFQDSDHQLFMSSMYEDVAFGPLNYGLSKEEVHQRTKNALEEVKIYHLKDRPIYRLSGGEKKLASIATVLSMGAECILFDEPSVALDPKNRRNLIRVLNNLKVGKIIASHDLDFIYDTCERTVLLSDGKIVADGPTKEILTEQDLLESHGLELPLSLQRK